MLYLTQRQLRPPFVNCLCSAPVRKYLWRFFVVAVGPTAMQLAVQKFAVALVLLEVRVFPFQGMRRLVPLSAQEGQPWKLTVVFISLDRQRLLGHFCRCSLPCFSAQFGQNLPDRKGYTYICRLQFLRRKLRPFVDIAFPFWGSQQHSDAIL
jgi:hypothetical protein